MGFLVILFQGLFSYELSFQFHGLNLMLLKCWRRYLGRGEIGWVRSGILGMADRIDWFGLEMMQTDSDENIRWTAIGSGWFSLVGGFSG